MSFCLIPKHVLVAGVCGFLNPSDLCSLRRTSRHFNDVVIGRTRCSWGEQMAARGVSRSVAGPGHLVFLVEVALHTTVAFGSVRWALPNGVVCVVSPSVVRDYPTYGTRNNYVDEMVRALVQSGVYPPGVVAFIRRLWEIAGSRKFTATFFFLRAQGQIPSSP